MKMASDDILRIDEATTVRTDGRTEFVANEASNRRDQQSFANFDEFKTHLGHLLGLQTIGGRP